MQVLEPPARGGGRRFRGARLEKWGEAAPEGEGRLTLEVGRGGRRGSLDLAHETPGLIIRSIFLMGLGGEGGGVGWDALYLAPF